MARSKWPALSAFLTGTLLLSREYKTSIAFQTPILSCASILASTGGAILATAFIAARRPDLLQSHSLPSNEKKIEESVRASNREYPSSLRTLRLRFTICVALLLIRILAAVHILANIQCAKQSPMPFLVIALALRDRRRSPCVRVRSKHAIAEQNPLDMFEQFAFGSRSSSLTSAISLGISSWSLLHYTSPTAATYICAASLGHHIFIPLFQYFSAVLDFLILALLDSLLFETEGRGTRHVHQQIASVGLVFTYSAGLIIAGSTFVALSSSAWHLSMDISAQFVWSLFKLCLFSSMSATGALFTTMYTGITTTAVIATFSITLSIAFRHALNSLHPYPVLAWTPVYVWVGLFLLSTMAYIHIDTTHGNASRRLFDNIPNSIPLGLVLILLCWTIVLAASATTMTYHPVQLMMYGARTDFETYLNRTSSTGRLKDSVIQYRRRYSMPPPPDFDMWYHFAMEKSSVVINDFDSIYDDLLPFRALKPAEIRQRTKQLLTDPHNNITGLRIRNGIASSIPGSVGPGTALSSDLVSMVKEFAKWLPDMDVAFNTAAGCAVTTPYSKIERLTRKARAIAVPARPVNVFSTQRAEQWVNFINASTIDNKIMYHQIRDSFRDVGSFKCPPRSSARSSFPWELSKLCVECARPHSMGPFVSNWTLSLDPCHQPDLAYLHGKYIDKPGRPMIQDLYPVFSPYKFGSCNDIIYPSIREYQSSAEKDGAEVPTRQPFSAREDTLFWRDTNTEGHSSGNDQWRGMARQRFAHVAHNINNSAPAQAVLLPQPAGPLLATLAYENVPVAKLSELIATDVHFVDSITDCSGSDCIHQETEFAPLAKSVSLGHHWRYKYLLDVDGAQPSDRFIPFLRSASLPFKATIFREWWTSRVHPWVHFIPLDIRAHGLWATLAYFQGIDGKFNGRNVKAAARAKDAERVAMQARLWAESALRKEDMEVYMFRLLLEWGRLTDDRRDELGFVSEG